MKSKFITNRRILCKKIEQKHKKYVMSYSKKEEKI